MRQLLSFVLSLLCVNCLFAYETTVDGITWTYTVMDDGTAALIRSSSSSPTVPTSTTGAITIPSSLDGYFVTRISDFAFKGCSGLTSVIIPNSVTSIGQAAFYYCNGLANVLIPDSVMSIGSSAFGFCNDMLYDTETISGVKLVDGWAIGNEGPMALTGNLDLIGIRGIGDDAFNGCGYLTNVLIQSGIVSIGEGAFRNCNGLIHVSISDSVANIGCEAFRNCSCLRDITIPHTVTNIGKEAFYNCNSLSRAYLSKDYTGSMSGFQLAATSIIRYIFDQTVTFDVADGEVSPTTQIVHYGAPYGSLPTPTRIGYIFKGWRKNGLVIDADTVVTALDNHVLEAKWLLNRFSVTFDANGGEGGTNTMQSADSAIVAPLVMREGYTFIGWNPAVAESVPENDVTYVAQWKINQYTQIFNANDGIGGTTNTLDYGSVLVAPAVTRVGYVFEKWDPELPNVVPAKDTTYYAVWTPNKYTLTFLANDGQFYGTGLVGTRYVTGDCGARFYAPYVTRDGHTLIGWEPGLPDTIPASNATYRAKWMVKEYEVTFDANGGTGGEVVIQDYGAPLVAPMVSRQFYTFIGWLPNEPTTVPARNVTYIAQWRGNPYIQTFDANGGIGSTSGSQDYNSVFVAPTVTREGYTFVGWSPSLPSTVPACDMTYTAQWQINQYTVTFDANGGTGGTSETLDYGTNLSVPTVAREGYTFAGWSPAVPATVPDGDATYMAQWQINQYTVTFDANGGTGGESATLDYSVSLTAPTVIREGYTFEGWLPAVPTTVPAGNATYTAQWQINQHRVTFDAQGGNGGWTKVLDYGSAIVAPNPTRVNYIFEGWEPTPDAVVPDHDVTYRAQWRCTWDIIVSSTSLRIKELYPDYYQYITNIVIDASVVALPDDFFEGCDALERLAFLSPDTELGNNDLRKVGKLFANQPDGYWVVQGVLLGYKGTCPREIPCLDGIKRIIGDALEGCKALEELNFTAESILTTIGTNAFKQCTELQQMTLPPSLEEIGDEAFMGCSYLGNVIVPGRVRKIGDRAFKNCTGFTAAQIEYGVESLGAESFYGDWRIGEVDIPSTVTNIGVNAFGGDSSIIRIGLRGDVRKASEIFSNYKFIREATVKEGDGEIVDGLFQGFEKLRDVRFFGDCPALANEGQLLYAMTPNNTGTDPGLTTYVSENSTGWDGTQGSHSLPQAWPLVGGSRRSIAYWDIPTYLCQFDSNGGTLGIQDTYQYSEKPFSLPPEPVQSGYKFAGWWTKPVGGLHITDDTIFIEGVYTMLYAHWIKGHWVFLDPNGGTVVNDFVTYVEETTYGVLPLAVRSGYAFNGWLYNGVRIEPSTKLCEEGDHTLVAQWIANLYSVHYNANGGIGSMEDESCVYGVETALRKNIFTNDGFVFGGWATNETGDVVFADCETISNLTAVANGWVELYAVWEESDVNPDPSNLNFYFTGDANWERCSEGVVVEKDGNVLRYESVWRSGMVTNNQMSVLAADVYGAGKIGFWWKVSCESFRDWKLDNLEFAIDGVAQEPWINGETDWQYLEFEIDASGSHTLTWTYYKDEEGTAGEDCGRVTAAVWTPVPKTLGDYVNCPRLAFYSEGDAEWFGTQAESHDGIASLRSGIIGHNGISTLKVDVSGEGRVGFWWKVSSESFRQLPIDYCSFAIDGVEQSWIGGEVNWTNVAFNVVGDGSHTLSWSYMKDGEGSVGSDCAWLDEVIWMPNEGTPPELTLEEVESWISSDLSAQFAKSGESAAEYRARFVQKFGADPVAALSMPTDKKDSQGNDMYVWQDYVAGTDPTDTNSAFTAKVEMVDGLPVVTWEPKLSAGEEARRSYTIYGKTNLTDRAWHSPTNEASRFFKVGVEMR